MKIQLFIFIFLAVTAGTAACSEPTQKLLNELIQPHLIVDNKGGEGKSALPADAGSTLFTLEELNNGTADFVDLALPETEPIADIPLTLNDKVEYFSLISFRPEVA
jgi:hypothetical protein